MTAAARTVDDLPNALRDGGWLLRRLAGREPAVFLDYDGVLTPIVPRPEDAVLSPGMRDTVRALALRLPVCVVSGRDRTVLQQLLGLGELVVAGSHGFDIWCPQRGTIDHEAASGYENLVADVTERLRAEVCSIQGAVVEPKRASVAVHYRSAGPADRSRVLAAVDSLLAERRDELKLTPGKMVAEIQPAIDWNKGRAVMHLLSTLGLDGADRVPLYLGDDVTDEDAFDALTGHGVGIIVGSADDPEVAGRATSADLALRSPAEVETFLTGLAR